MHYKHLIGSFAKAYPFRIIGTFVVSFVSQLFTIFLPIYIALSYDLLFDVQSHRARLLGFIPEEWIADFEGYFTLFVVVLIIRGVLDFCERYFTSYLGEIHLSFLRMKIFDHQLKMSMQVYDEKGFAKYLLRYSGDLTSIQAFLSKGIIRFGSDMVLLVLALGIFFSLHLYLGITLSVLSILLAVVVYLLNRFLYNASVARRNAKSGLLKFVTSRLQGLLTIKVFNRFVPEMGRYQKRVATLLRLGRDYQQITSLIGAVIPFGLYLTIGMVMWVTVHLKNEASSGVDPKTFFTALLLLITITPVFRRCFRVSIVWRNGGISYQKLADILQLPREHTTGTVAVDWKDPDIVTEKLVFTYPGQDIPVLQDLDLNIPFGQITAIQGNGGMGKTTLLKLLNGLYVASAGEIRIAGTPIENINIKTLRKNMAVITDQCTLLGKTVFEAVSYSRKAKHREQVTEILDVLGLLPSLPLDYRIGEMACNLSKGQQKLLMYARAFLTKKSILLIDEPFSELDTDSIYRVIRYLNQIRYERTIVLLSCKRISEYLEIDVRYELKSPYREEPPIEPKVHLVI